MRIGKFVAGVSVVAVSLALSAPVWSHSDEADAEAIDYAHAEEHEFGRASDPAKAARTIDIDMSDSMRFAPGDITVKKGDTVRFVVKNNGQLLHEMVLGTLDDLAEHAKMMQKFPGMEHSEPYMAHVDVGDTQEMGWQFTNAGVFYYGCLQPGHYEAGMKGRIIVQ